MGVIILQESSKSCPRIYTGDNESTTLKIDISDLIDQYPEGYGSIWWTYPDGKKSLLMTSVEDDTYLVTTLGKNEIPDNGYYRVQGEWTSGDYLKKTSIFKIYVSRSLADDDEGDAVITIQPEYVNDFKRMTAEVSKNTAKVEEYTEEVQETYEHVRALHDQLYEDINDFVDQTAEVKRLRDEVVRLDSDVNTKAEEVEDNRRHVAEDLTAVNEAAAVVAQDKSDVGEMKTSVESTKESVDSTAEIVAQDKSDVTSMKDSVTEMSEQVARDASINTNPPRIGENGNWMVWDPDNNVYIDSGIKANGIYVGTDTPPAGYDIWIDTTATITP